jgi:hypothetical protein
MRIRTDEEVLKECDKLDEPAVEARLKTGYFADNPTPAYEWLIQRRTDSEHRRRQQEIKNIQLTAYASWALAIVTLVLVGITFLGIWWQKVENREQREHAKEQLGQQLEQQRKDSQAQRDDAKALLSVQISVEMDKQFDSPEMRNARRRLAAELLSNKEVTETRLLDFFDKVAMYTHQDLIDQHIVYSSYSYWLERYWPAIKTSIKEFRKLENDSGFYQDTEELYGEMLADDAKELGKSVDQVAPSKSQIHRFLVEEATLPK